MSVPDLGRLERVDLRAIWEKEDSHFTPWLAGDDNLRLLGDALGIELELEAQEKDVGPFRADILCKDTLDGSWVLIENQLEATDHKHLGQLMTYAAGLDAVTIVWVAAKFTDEHRAAVDWLNHITADKFRFFGLEVELWRIGASPPAPKFNIISKPNDWSNSVTTAARSIKSEAMTATEALRLEYWTAFNAFLTRTGSGIRQRKPSANHWMHFGIGRSEFGNQAYCSVRDGEIGLSLNCYPPHAKEHFRQLLSHKAEIEAGVGEPLDWHELPEKKESRIYLNKALDPKDRATWDEQFRWLADRLSTFDRVFRPRIRHLEARETAIARAEDAL